MIKADYVRRAPNDGKHACHWPGCNAQIKPAFWGCFKHWSLIPYPLKQAIWDTYNPGQEISKSPTPAYLKAANDVEQFAQRYIIRNEHPEKITERLSKIQESSKPLSDWEKDFISKMTAKHYGNFTLTDNEYPKLQEIYYKISAAPARRLRNPDGTKAY